MEFLMIRDRCSQQYYSILIILIFFSLSDYSTDYAQDIMKGNFKKSFSSNLEQYGHGENLFIDFYQKWLSPAKGSNQCPMHPSCSQYTKIAFHHLPWHQASITSFERLLRCGKELYLYPKIQTSGGLRWHDPLVFTGKKNGKTFSSVSMVPDFKQKERIENILLIQEAGQEEFADYLFKQGEYFRAVTEYQRILFITTDSTRKIQILRNIGLCYFYDTDYEGYIAFLNNNRRCFQSYKDIAVEMDLYLGKSYYHLAQYPKAITSLEWININSNQPFFDETQLVLGFTYARIFDWEGSVKKMQQIKPDSPRSKIAGRFKQSLQKFNSLPVKSSFLAGSLSAMIPGTGYVYCNRKGTGLTSLIINGLFIWTIRDALVKKQYGLAVTAGFFEIGWYLGNIKGSADAANTYNAYIRHKFIDDLLEEENLQEFKKQ